MTEGNKKSKVDAIAGGFQHTCPPCYTSILDNFVSTTGSLHWTSEPSSKANSTLNHSCYFFFFSSCCCCYILLLLLVYKRLLFPPKKSFLSYHHRIIMITFLFFPLIFLMELNDREGIFFRKYYIHRQETRQKESSIDEPSGYMAVVGWKNRKNIKKRPATLAAKRAHRVLCV